MEIVPVNVFFSYAPTDKELRDKLATHLAGLKKAGVIENWHDHEAIAGSDLEYEINSHLEKADIILLLISADFLESKYCDSQELDKAIKRHDSKQARIIPVLLQPVDYRNTPFSKLSPLPKNGIFITKWENKEEAFTEVTKGIREAVDYILKQRGIQQKHDAVSDYKKKVGELIADGKISDIDELTLDDERERLGLSLEQAKKIRKDVAGSGTDPDSCNKYRNALQLLLDTGRYPFSSSDRSDLELLQRQLEIKKGDAEKIEKEFCESTAIPKVSDKKIDYARLHDLLEQGRWERADQETLKILLSIAGRENEKWLMVNHFQSLSFVDLFTIDRLWSQYSAQRFGFMVQQEVWERVNSNSKIKKADVIREFCFACQFGEKRNGLGRWWNGDEILTIEQIYKKVGQIGTPKKSENFDSVSKGLLPAIIHWTWFESKNQINCLSEFFKTIEIAKRLQGRFRS